MYRDYAGELNNVRPTTIPTKPNHKHRRETEKIDDCWLVENNGTSSSFIHSFIRFNSGSKTHKTTDNDIKTYENITTDRQKDRKYTKKLYKRVLDRIQRKMTQMHTTPQTFGSNFVKF